MACFVLSFAQETKAIASARPSKYARSCSSPHHFEALLREAIALWGLFDAITFTLAPKDAPSFALCPWAENSEKQAHTQRAEPDPHYCRSANTQKETSHR